MFAARIILILWGALLILFTLPGSFVAPTFSRLAWACFAILLVASAIGCLWNVRWCWWIALFGCLISLLSYAPMIVQNTYMFCSSHPLYVDSPATILVVVALALVFIAPPSLIMICLLFDRRQFVKVLRRTTVSSTDMATGIRKPGTDNPYEPPSE